MFFYLKYSTFHFEIALYQIKIFGALRVSVMFSFLLFYIFVYYIFY